MYFDHYINTLERVARDHKTLALAAWVEICALQPGRKKLLRDALNKRGVSTLFTNFHSCCKYSSGRGCKLSTVGEFSDNPDCSLWVRESQFDIAYPIVLKIGREYTEDGRLRDVPIKE
jgi:hypothetical protein